MLQGRRPVIYGDGEQKMFFWHRWLHYCLDKLMTDKNVKSQTVNIGPDEEFVTINEIFNILSNKLKFNQNLCIFPID